MAITVLLLSGIAPTEAVQPVQLFQPFHFICVDGKTSQLIDGGFGEKAVCRNSSYSFRVDVLSGSESTKNPLSVFLCIDSLTKEITYGTTSTAYCSDGTYFKVTAFNLLTSPFPAEDIHIICNKSFVLTYGNFGKNAKCPNYAWMFGIAGTRANIDNTTIWTSTGESVSVVNVELGSDYLLCSDIETNVVTHPIGNQKTCGKNSISFRVGAKGQNGATGLTGATGLNGVDGRDGKTLWNGTKDPENTWGAPGDMYINATAKTLFGPKNLDGTWPAGVSMVGPKGDQGPIGLTGVQGPSGGSGGAGPAGATGATGAAGAAGANGSNGADGQGPTFYKFDAGVEITRAGVETISLSLGAGTYLLTYIGIAFSLTSNQQEGVSCSIESNIFNASRMVYIYQNAMDGQLHSRKYMTEQKILTLNSPGTAKVYCGSQYADDRAMVIEQSLTALKVSSATIQP